MVIAAGFWVGLGVEQVDDGSVNVLAVGEVAFLVNNHLGLWKEAVEVGRYKKGIALGEPFGDTLYLITLLAGGETPHENHADCDVFDGLNHLDEILVADALVLDHAVDGVGKHVGYADLLDLGTALRVGDGVGEDNLLKGRCLYTVAGGAAHHAV